MKKLPRIDALYWAFIISSTTLGETAGDLISMTLDFGYGGSTLVLIGLFVIALVAELAFRTQHAAMYWIVIILASIAGTTLSDYVTRTLGLGYPKGTALIAVILALVMLAWRLVSRSMDLRAALDRKVEALYWLAILASSTLGTVFGDLISNGTSLGFAGGTLVLLGLLSIIAGLALLTRTPRMLLYWLGIVITHPLGATLGDYMTKYDGLKLGNVKSTLILVGVFAVLASATWGLRRRKSARER